jgi:hypothetical protein
VTVVQGHHEAAKNEEQIDGEIPMRQKGRKGVCKRETQEKMVDYDVGCRHAA